MYKRQVADGGPTAVWGCKGDEGGEKVEDSARRHARKALELEKAEEEAKERERTDRMIENLRRAREANRCGTVGYCRVG